MKYLVGLGWALFLAVPASAQEDQPLTIATKQAAPFSFRVGDGPWQGISIDLWQGIAKDLDLQFEFQEATLDDLITGLVDGRFDASVAALTVTSEREQLVDFSHAFHPSGLGIAVPADRARSVPTVLKSLMSMRFLQAVGTLVVVLFLGGLLLWLLERKKNRAQFGGTLAQGLGSAFWWSAVTMTTVGYGDKAPTTFGGRAVAMVWMFASIIMISGLTAAIASTLTVSQLEHSVGGPEDLPSLGRLGCVRGSTGEAYLRSERLLYQEYDSAEDALRSLAAGTTQAVVYDAPILQYLSSTEFEDTVRVLPVTFERQDYAIALPLDSPLRKDVNTALLNRVSGEEWQDVLYRYLGTGR